MEFLPPATTTASPTRGYTATRDAINQLASWESREAPGWASSLQVTRSPDGNGAFPDSFRLGRGIPPSEVVGSAGSRPWGPLTKRRGRGRSARPVRIAAGQQLHFEPAGHVLRCRWLCSYPSLRETESSQARPRIRQPPVNCSGAKTPRPGAGFSRQKGEDGKRR